MHTFLSFFDLCFGLCFFDDSCCVMCKLVHCSLEPYKEHWRLWDMGSRYTVFWKYTPPERDSTVRHRCLKKLIKPYQTHCVTWTALVAIPWPSRESSSQAILNRTIQNCLGFPLGDSRCPLWGIRSGTRRWGHQRSLSGHHHDFAVLSCQIIAKKRNT